MVKPRMAYGTIKGPWLRCTRVAMFHCRDHRHSLPASLSRCVRLWALIFCALPSALLGSESIAITGAIVPIKLQPDADSERCTLRHGDKVLLNLRCAKGAPPALVAQFTDANESTRQLLVLQEKAASPDGRDDALHVLAVAENGEVDIIGRIDCCGGKTPVLKREGRRVLITRPTGAASPASGTLPRQQWVVEDGRVHRRIQLRIDNNVRVRDLSPEASERTQEARNRAMVAERAGDLTAAEAGYLDAWQLLPEPRHIWESSEITALDLVALYFKRAQYDLAQQWLETADLSGDGTANPTVVLWLGKLRFQLGDKDAAYHAFDALYRAWGERPFDWHSGEYLKFYLDERSQRQR
jgi:hypothetical protein